MFVPDCSELVQITPRIPATARIGAAEKSGTCDTFNHNVLLEARIGIGPKNGNSVAKIAQSCWLINRILGALAYSSAYPVDAHFGARSGEHRHAYGVRSGWLEQTTWTGPFLFQDPAPAKVLDVR